MNGVKEEILKFLDNPIGFSTDISPTLETVWMNGLNSFIAPILAKSKPKITLMPAQMRAWSELSQLRMGLILGPPGTGKTFTLACMAAGYLYARKKSGLPCRILITGFTRESMGNLVDKIALFAPEFGFNVPFAFVGNPPGSKLIPPTEIQTLGNNESIRKSWNLLRTNDHVITAYTNWGLSKLFNKGRSMSGASFFKCDGKTARIFDLILIDEASQMLVSQGLMALSGLAEKGRIIVAGDDNQLTPVRNTTEIKVADGRKLGSSLYSFLKSANVKEFALDKTFRLNDPLIEFPREHVYGAEYSSANPHRQLKLSKDWYRGLSEWEKASLNPEFPVTVLVHDGPQSGTENPFERHLIKRLVALFSERMVPQTDDSILDETTFWSENLAVVTPHRLQNAVLRDELSSLPFGNNAFVDTVDRIQGRERDAVIAAYTVADPEFANQIADFIFSPNRLNVVATRSRSKLILLVSRHLLEVMPKDDDLLENAFLLREFIYECDLADTFSLEDSDGEHYETEIRVRTFDQLKTSKIPKAMFGSKEKLKTSHMDEEMIKSKRGRIIRVRFEDIQVANEEIRNRLNLPDRRSYSGQSYWYLVSTGALAILRSTPKGDNLCPPHQKKDGLSKLRFDDVIRLKLEKSNISLITRLEERVFMKRAIEKEFKDDSDRVEQIKHDLFVWRDALLELDRRGINLASDIKSIQPENFVNSRVFETLKRLQIEYNQQKSRSGKLSFENATYEYLKRDFLQKANVVVMEGFTFLTPLQNQFIEACLRNGTDVYFIHPYVEKQRRGFAIFDRTYDDLMKAENSTEILIPEPNPPKKLTSLAYLQRNLFLNLGERKSLVAADDSVQIEVFPHRHGEIKGCVEKVKEYIDSGKYSPGEIAIVARDPNEVKKLFQEQTDLLGVPTMLKLEPRLLLLTPVGRFLLTLYDIKSNGDFEMTPDQFNTILASGWLGSSLQETVDEFTIVRSQLFERCRTFDDWIKEISNGMDAIDLVKGSRLPITVVSNPTLSRWKKAVKTVRDLGNKLFAGTDRVVGDYIERMIDTLKSLDSEVDIRIAEKQIIDRISEALQTVATDNDLRITGVEFGDILNSLVRDNEEDDKFGSDEVSITSPEGLDSSSPILGKGQKKVVLFVGVDDGRVPRAAPDPWPFFEYNQFNRNIDKNQELERYYFLSTIRAATERIHISYSITVEGKDFRQSPYIDEILKLIDLGDIGIDEIESSGKPLPPDARPVRVERDSYELNEIARFGLCPYRYRLERFDSQSGVYRDMLHLKFLAQSIWLEIIFDYCAKEELRFPNTDQGIQLLLLVRNKTEDQARSEFKTLPDFQWRDVKKRIRVTLNNLHSIHSKTRKPYWIRRNTKSIKFEIQTEREKKTVESTPKFIVFKKKEPRKYLIMDELLRSEWLLPMTSRDDKSISRRVQVQKLSLFSNLYHAVQWWQKAKRIAFKQITMGKEGDFSKLKAEVTDFIKGIEQGFYPKNPGDHCDFCPAKSLCLKLPEEEYLNG